MEKDKLIQIARELLAPQLLLFNLGFVYIGMLFVPGLTLRTIMLITVAFISARSSGIIMNRYIGREVDLKNHKKRNMASLRIPKGTLLLLFATCAIIFIASAYLLNTLSFILTPIVLLFFVIDPLLKRHTSKRHYFLGIIEGFDVIGGYIGAAGAIPVILAPYILMLAVAFIGGGFDTLYSLVHREFDVKEGLKTFASTKGISKALNYSLYSHINAAILILDFAFLSGKFIICMGAIGAAAVLLAQHIDVDISSDAAIWQRISGYNNTASIILLISVVLSLV